MDEWKIINEYPDYAISKEGQVKSLRFNRILKISYNDSGYGYVRLSKNKISKSKSIHSLVMKYFGSEKPKENYVIDHINGNKRDNSIDNLEWVSTQVNTLRGYGNQDKKQKVYELHDRGLTYAQISRETGFDYQFVRTSILTHRNLQS